jgi:hypothetical protein
VRRRAAPAGSACGSSACLPASRVAIRAAAWSPGRKMCRRVANLYNVALPQPVQECEASVLGLLTCRYPCKVQHLAVFLHLRTGSATAPCCRAMAAPPLVCPLACFLLGTDVAEPLDRAASVPTLDSVVAQGASGSRRRHSPLPGCAGLVRLPAAAVSAGAICADIWGSAVSPVPRRSSFRWSTLTAVQF